MSQREDGRDRQADRVLKWQGGRLVPGSDPPESEPVPSLPPDDSVPPKRRRRGMVGSLKAWAESLGHVQKIIVAVVAIAGAASASLAGLARVGWELVSWVTTRPSQAEMRVAVAKACEQREERIQAIESAVADAGTRIDLLRTEQGTTWDRQDAINADVHKRDPYLRQTTPPAALGPKAKTEGRQ